MLALVIKDHPHRTLAHFRGKLVRCLAHDAPSYSRVGASGKPGAVQFSTMGIAALQLIRTGKQWRPMGGVAADTASSTVCNLMLSRKVFFLSSARVHVNSEQVRRQEFAH